MFLKRLFADVCRVHKHLINEKKHFFTFFDANFITFLRILKRSDACNYKIFVILLCTLLLDPVNKANNKVGVLTVPLTINFFHFLKNACLRNKTKTCDRTPEVQKVQRVQGQSAISVFFFFKIYAHEA